MIFGAVNMWLIIVHCMTFVFLISKSAPKNDHRPRSHAHKWTWSYPHKYMWRFNSMRSHSGGQRSVCVSLSHFYFYLHVMWEFWVPSPTVQAICAPLSLSNHPTNTHSWTHTWSHSSPTHTVDQQRHGPVHTHIQYTHAHTVYTVIQASTACLSASTPFLLPVQC